MKITVDPFAPSSVTTTFYGPTKQAERYRSMYQERIDDWNTNDDIYRNFLKIFGTIHKPLFESRCFRRFKFHLTFRYNVISTKKPIRHKQYHRKLQHLLYVSV